MFSTCFSPQCRENSEHFVKGTGWGSLTVISSLAIATLTGLAIVISFTVFAGDGLMLYSCALVDPLHLIWAVPFAVVLIGIDLIAIFGISKITVCTSQLLAKASSHCKNQTVNHFRAIRLT